MPRITHGASKSKIYMAWQSARQHTLNPQSPRWPSGGGRGITICARWTGPDGYATFIADMGPPPAGRFRLVRLDPDGDYTPANCRWRPCKPRPAPAVIRLCAICQAPFWPRQHNALCCSPGCRSEAKARRQRRPGYLAKKVKADARRYLRQRIALAWFESHNIDVLEETDHGRGS